jgi:hypothetical protein
MTSVTFKRRITSCLLNQRKAHNAEPSAIWLSHTSFEDVLDLPAPVAIVLTSVNFAHELKIPCEEFTGLSSELHNVRRLSGRGGARAARRQMNYTAWAGLRRD